MFAAPPGPYVIHMCPPMTVKNYKEWKSLLAIGNSFMRKITRNYLTSFYVLGCPNGDIVIFHLDDGSIQRQLAVHSCSVRYELISKKTN